MRNIDPNLPLGKQFQLQVIQKELDALEMNKSSFESLKEAVISLTRQNLLTRHLVGQVAKNEFVSLYESSKTTPKQPGS